MSSGTCSTSPCTSERINSLLQHPVEPKPPFCPPCVGELEEELLELINANATAAASALEQADLLNRWLFD